MPLSLDDPQPVFEPPPGPDDRWVERRAWTIALLRRSAPLLLALSAAFVGVVAYATLFPPPPPLQINQVNERIEQTLAEVTPSPAYSSQVYQIILPSLVLIQTERASEKEDAEQGKFGIGAGVVINENGEILTAHHVVSGALTINVHFVDGSETKAAILSAEPENDIAVLTLLETPGLIVPAVLGSPGAMRVGDEAFAVGNPLGLVASMSAGVISGFDRSIPVDESGQRLEGLIQFDTAVNPGNSGGPLLNRQGQVVGIVTALANPSEQNFFVGIGFAVPIGTAVAAGGGGPQY